MTYHQTYEVGSTDCPVLPDVIGDVCMADDPDSLMVCTRITAHTGRHAATGVYSDELGGRPVYVVWSD